MTQWGIGSLILSRYESILLENKSILAEFSEKLNSFLNICLIHKHVSILIENT